MIPSYPFICKTFNNKKERAVSFEYDDYLYEITKQMIQDPRLPIHIKENISNYKWFERDLLRRVIRSYAFALRYPVAIQEPIWIIQSALHHSIKAVNGSMRYTNHRLTKRWRYTWSKKLLDELYDEAETLERLVTPNCDRLRIPSFWGD